MDGEIIIQIMIFVTLGLIYVRLSAVLDVLENNFVQIDSNQSKMIQELEHIESNTK
tara:strand:- start:325 stop:492 length:168 start_codon:yes stop_codon:yes gene_type:complete